MSKALSISRHGSASTITIDTFLNGMDAIMMFFLGFPTLYIAVKVKSPVIQKISLLLALFVIIHGAWHLLDAVGTTYSISWVLNLAVDIVQPLSFVILLGFAVYFAKRGG